MVAIAALRGETDGKLQLVAEAGSHSWRDFVVEKGEILARDQAGGAVRLPADVHWRLEGDPRANAALFQYSPTYGITTNYPHDTLSAPRSFAIVKTYDGDWPRKALQGGVVVGVWFVDGRPEIVQPVAATPADERYFAAVHLFELNARRARGWPLMLLFSQGQFVSPGRYFAEATAQRALEAMHFGSEAEKKEAIEHLSSAKTSNPGGVTLLHIAAEAGMNSAVELLLQRGAPPGAKTTRGWRAIDWAALNGRRESVRLLLAADPKLADDATVNLAASAGHAEIADDVAAAAPGLSTDQLARVAVAQGRFDIVERLVKRTGERALAQVTDRELTPVILRHEDALLEFVLAHGLDAKRASSGVVLASVAAAAGDERALTALLQAGANPSAASETGATPLMIAASGGFTSGVRMLLAAHADAGAADKRGATALHYAVANGHGAVVTLLLQAGLRFDRPDKEGQTPLELALASRSQSIVEELVNAGARLNVKGKKFEDSIMHAIALDQAEIVGRALADGCPRNRTIAGLRLDDLADGFAAEKVGKLLHQDDAGARGGFAIEETPGVAPRPTEGTRPIDPRPWESPQPALTVQVSGVVDTDGRFILPRWERCDDAAVAKAILGAIPSWRFVPARKQGRVVRARLTLAIGFQAHSNQIFAADDVDTRPTVLTSSGISASSYQTYRLGPVQEFFTAVTDDSGRYLRTDSIRLPTVEPVIEQSQGELLAVAFIVEPDGQATDIETLTGYGAWFREAALNALRRYHFSPGLRNGVPVRTHMTMVLQPD
jgi:ankyrin repeat protein